MTYADVKIRKEHAEMLRALAARLGIKVADALALWPKCPKCGSLLVQVGERTIICSNCKREYVVQERP
jgi:uncharacterized Zn finger protein (UPF0148 family)